MAKKTVVVVGSSNIDMSIRVRHLPRAGETILGADFACALGGKGANQAVAASRAGASVFLVARLGADAHGDDALSAFKKNNINTRFIVRDQFLPTGVACILVNKDGENSIAVALGANDKLSPKNICQAKTIIKEAGILLMQLETPLETVCKAAELATKAGVISILNPAPARELPRALIQNISILTPNKSEAEILSGVKITHEDHVIKAADILLALGVKILIITLGARGALLARGAERRFIPAFKVDVVDSTAAGDVFNGALAAQLIEEKPLIESIYFANAAAALCVARFGAQTSIPLRKDIEDFLKN